MAAPDTDPRTGPTNAQEAALLAASAAATNRVAVVSESGSAFEKAVASYVSWLARQPLADRTKREYGLGAVLRRVGGGATGGEDRLAAR